MTRTRRFLSGVAVGYASQVLITLVGLWLTNFLLHELGQSDYGLWLVTAQILSYLVLLDLGVVALLPRETAFATGRAGSDRTSAELPDIVARTTILVLWQTPLVAAASFAVWYWLPTDWAALRNPLGIVLLGFVLTYPTRVFKGALEGLQDLAYVGANHTVTWLVGTGLSVALVVLGFGLDGLAYGWVSIQVLSAAGWLIRLRRVFPGTLPKRLGRWPWPEMSRRIKQGLWISMQQIAQVLLHGSDLLIIGRLLGPAAVVPYFATMKVMQVLSNQPLMLIQSAGPGLSELRVSESAARLRDVSTALTQAILVMSGGIVCVVLAVNQPFVVWWLGAEQFGGVTLTAVLLIGMLMRHWNVTLVYTAFAFGHDRRISIITLTDGVVTVGASILLVLRFGPIGAAVGSIVGVVLVSLPANLRLVARETSDTVRGQLASMGSWAWRFAIPLAAAAFLATVDLPASVLVVVALAAGIGVVYAVLMIPLAVRDPLGIYVRPRLEAMRRWFGAPDRSEASDG